ncbi:MAG TPA: hypothetical protein VGK78_16870 [Nocardioides sp.]|uniref:hypothetical protein n=1 Tax=Nocardioides sp. TaxID=35761 RepID=UPI002F40BFA8
MTDRPDAPEGSEPPEIAEVRRLLAESRHADPMPDEVAARMDDVLARLGAETPLPRDRQFGVPVGSADVVPIAAHRRRRVAGLLVAAAAVVVGGVVVAPHLSSGSGPTSTASSAQDNAGGRASENLGNSGNAQQGDQRTTPEAANSQVRDGRLVVRPRHFSADALQGRTLLHRKQTFSLDQLSCADVPRDLDTVAAEYQHAPAALVYRRAEGSTQVVDLYVCGSARPIRSTTLPAP